MLIILPPSETKTSGGSSGALDLTGLSFPGLAAHRAALLQAVEQLAANEEQSMAALKLGPKQLFEVERNRTVSWSPTLPVLERYTGVLFDPIEASELTTQEREFAARHVVVHSALFGFVGAADLIPVYRLSHNSRVPGFALGKHWGDALRSTLSARDDLILDLRSQAYVALGPAPVREGSYYLRVVTEGTDGRKRALNHFNKTAKGSLVRALITSGANHATASELIDWATGAGFRLSPGAPGELELVV